MTVGGETRPGSRVPRMKWHKAGEAKRAPRCHRNLEIFFRNGTKLFFFVRNYATHRDVLFDLPRHSQVIKASQNHMKANCTDELGFCVQIH